MYNDLGDIEDIVNKWAMEHFEMTKDGWQKKLKASSLLYRIDWGKVLIEHDSPNLTDKMVDVEPDAFVLFKSTFRNTTDAEQKYSYSSTRSTRKTAEVTMSSTFTKGGEAGLTLKLPGDLVELGCNFNRELALTNERKETFEEEMTWSVTGELTAPPGEARCVKVSISEISFCCDFNVRTSLSGRVSISITNPEDNNSLVKHVNVDIFPVLKKFMAKSADAIFNEETKTVNLVSRGRAKFRFGTEQRVHVENIAE